MADYLIQRDGFPRVVQYYRSLALIDRHAAFERSFGQSIDAFEAEILLHLQTRASDPATAPAASPR
jgi:hypothetical protein